ncbi:MAG: restriction endonuclease [Patescibacteria group bacterium]|jgi:hypothetical protein
MTKQPAWKTYEEVACFLLNQMRAEFGLEDVQGKQKVAGNSGTLWEIDGKGICQNGTGFLLIECRRYTNSKIKQEEVAAIAFRIQDTGAVGGIIVTPIGLQEGAKKIASGESIVTVHMTPESDCSDFVLRFLNKIFIGKHDTVHIEESVEIKIIHADGTVENHPIS